MYVTQVAKAPPALAVFCNLERDIPSHYKRFLEGRFRAALDLAGSGTPLRIEFHRARKSRTGAYRPTSTSTALKRGAGVSAATDDSETD